MRQRLIVATLCLVAPAAARGQQTPEQMLRSAEQLAKEGRAARAIKVYKTFLQKHPSHSQVTDAHYRLAKCLDAIGWVDEAIPHLEKVIHPRNRRYRQRLEAFHMLGKLRGSLKQYDRALKTFEQMLTEGAGLYEGEVMSLCAGYYAILKKYDDAAAKLNLLLRKRDSRYAEPAAYKLVLLWLHAEKLDHAVDALQQLAQEFPNNKQMPGLMVRIADLCRRQRKHREAMAIAEQLKRRFPDSLEALAGGYVLGLCYRDRKDFEKATAVFEEIARNPKHRGRALSAEALLQSADIHFFELLQPDKAIRRYEEAAALARNSDSERKDSILEQCYFRLAEHHYQQKKWSVALENYQLLRRTGTKLNVLGRIMKCQAELELDQRAGSMTQGDVEIIKKKIEASPGTFAAAEGEVFLIDRKFARTSTHARGLDKIAEEYRGLLKKYPKEVLATSSLASYIYSQMGLCHARARNSPVAWKEAIRAFEKCIEVEPQTPYKVQALENIARLADQVGDKQKSFETYEKLYALSARELAGAEKPDAELVRRNVEYLRGMLTRAEEKDSIDRSIELVQSIRDKKGIFSEAARQAQYYLGELHFIKKDFSAAVKAFRLYIRTYGPKQDAKGDIEGAPWKPARMDEKTEQLYDAAVRIAHAWYLQGHTQNMVKAYQWILRNIPHENPHLAEANYWLALELGKGRKGRTRQGRRAMAEALWKDVVNASFNFADPKFPLGFHLWVRQRDKGYQRVQKYVKSAILKSAEVFAEQGEHELAARVLEQYMALYPLPAGSRYLHADRDETYDIARYALGREYIAGNEVAKLIKLYEPFTYGSRDDRFRVSALDLLGHLAGKHERYDVATLAYATLLDEYGRPNPVDSEGNKIPIPRSQWIRNHAYHWDGIRMKPPKHLDPGRVRFALGLLYWKMEDWRQCVKTLEPLIKDAQFRRNKVRPKAIYMAGQSYYRMHDYANGVRLIRRLIGEHPRFEAIQEA